MPKRALSLVAPARRCSSLLALVPTLSLDIPVVFAGPLDSPGTLGLLALCLVFAGVALTYDLLFGFTGLLSFGHALYFAIGVYVLAIALTKWEWSLWQALALTAAVGIVVPLVLGAVSLRVGGIAFAMVTLAFAQAGQVLVQKNPDGLTGGEEGLGLNSDALPDFFVGVLNAKYLYWLALGYAAFVFVVVRLRGRVLAGPRLAGDPRERAPRRGDRPAPVRLQADRVRARLVPRDARRRRLAVVVGTGASPQVTTANFTLTLLVMVVIGGAGTRYGALLGGLPLHAARPPARLVRGLLAGAGPADGDPKAALRAALRPRHLLHPARLLRPGRARGLGRRVRLLRRSAGLDRPRVEGTRP